MNTRVFFALLLVSLVLGVTVSGEAPSKEQLGKVDFPNSCAPAVQEQFQRGVAMLHSFWYAAAEKAFQEVVAEDPSCAIATWGFASILMSNPLEGVGAVAAVAPSWRRPRSTRAGRSARRPSASATTSRRSPPTTRTSPTAPSVRASSSRAKAYEALAANYPNDDEAQIFYALYLAGTQTLADQTYAAYLKAAAILEKQFAKHPDHPGVAHYLIHSYDAPPIAPQGLPAARRYAGIAPAAPHALHMPSHIFTRVGAWTESVATNRRSADGRAEGQRPRRRAARAGLHGLRLPAARTRRRRAQA